jgi:predicted O-methyltransferase YrrM
VIGRADEAPVVWTSEDGFSVAGTDYSLVEFGRPRRGVRPGHDGPNTLAVYKSREQVIAFVDLVAGFPSARIVELGIKAGGSTALLAQLARPAKLVAVDVVSEPVRKLERFVDTHGLRDRIHPYYGVDQGDRRRLAGIVAEEFEGQAIDLVLDDASHLFEPTRASFEVLFPRLCTDGLFVIEDWSWEHAIASKVVLALSSESPTVPVPRLDLLHMFDALGVNPEMLAQLGSGEFLSDLISDVVVRKADGDTTIGDVTIRPFVTEIRRGPGVMGERGRAFRLAPSLAARGLYVGRLDDQAAPQIRRSGVKHLIVVSDEPPSEQVADWPEVIHVRCDPSLDHLSAFVRELGQAPFDLVIDGASSNAERARELASVLLQRVAPGGAYMLYGWQRLVAPPSGKQSDPQGRRMPLLLLELILAVAEWNDIIQDIVFGGEWLTVGLGFGGLSGEDFDMTQLYQDHFESLSRT